MQLDSKAFRAEFPPGAYIIGAPKCGTTALARYLSEHAQIAFSRPKEPHFFSSDLPGLRHTAELEGYRSFFEPAEGSRLLMEASVWYLYSQTAVRAILRVRPDARFIVMLRDPLRMLPSLHRQLVNAFDEDEQDFETAWHLSAQRARGERIPKTCRAPATLVYTRTAAYGAMLERLWDAVPRQQTQLVFQEEMQADSGAVYRRALEFLGLADDGRREFPRINAAKRQRSRLLGYAIARGGRIREAVSRPVKLALGRSSLGITRRLKRLNTVPDRPARPGPALEAEIARHYAPDIQRLAELTGGRIPAHFGQPRRARGGNSTQQEAGGSCH